MVELSNATLTNIEGFQANDADLTITINRSDLEKTMMGAASKKRRMSLAPLFAAGDAWRCPI